MAPTTDRAGVFERGPAPRLTVHERVLAWAVPPGWVALSSAAVGGGLVEPRWVLNIDVGGEFVRADLDDYVAETTARLGLAGPGCALLTAADVTQVEHAGHGGVQAWSTVGVTRPTWALAPGGEPTRPGPAPTPPTAPTAPTAPTPDDAAPEVGTVNIVVCVPVPLSPSALVQAVGTVTEAKAQVLVQAGVPGTGTASDAAVVLCPAAPAGAPARAGAGAPAAQVPAPAAVPFAGVRSPWGQRIARAVHATVAAGLAAHPWPNPDVDPAVVW